MKCFWIFGHDYTKWSERIQPYGENRQQWKKCKKCNKLLYRNIGYADGVDPSQVNKHFSILNTGNIKQKNKELNR